MPKLHGDSAEDYKATIPMRGNEIRSLAIRARLFHTATIPMRGNEAGLMSALGFVVWATIPMRGNEPRTPAASRTQPQGYDPHEG